MNEFERRALDIAERSNFLASVAREGQKIIRIDPFAYNVSIGSAAVPIAAAASGQGRIQFQSNSDFVIMYMSADAIGTTQCTVQVTDNGSGKTFFNQPTLMTLAFGTGGFLFLLPTPKIVEPSTNLTVDLTNVSAATNMTGAYFSFMGGRIYYAN